MSAISSSSSESGSHVEATSQVQVHADVKDVFQTVLGDILDDHVVFLSGSTPRLVADKIELLASQFASSRSLAKDFMAILCICSIGHRRTMEDFIAKKGGNAIKPFLDKHFMVNERYNYSALNIAGHSLLAAGGRTENIYIKEARKRMGGDNVWTAVFANGSCSEKQISIFNQRKTGLDRREATAAGKRIISVLLLPFKPKAAKPTAKGPVIKEDKGDKPESSKAKDPVVEVTQDKGKNKVDATPPAADGKSDDAKAILASKLLVEAVETAFKKTPTADTTAPEATKTVQDVITEMEKTVKKKRGPPTTDKARKVIRQKVETCVMKPQENESDADYLLRVSEHVKEQAGSGAINISHLEALKLAITLNGVDPGPYMPDGAVVIMGDEDYTNFLAGK